VVKVERGRLGRRRQRHMEGGGGGDNVARTSACPAIQQFNFSVVVMHDAAQGQAQLKTCWNVGFTCKSDVAMNRRR